MPRTNQAPQPQALPDLTQALRTLQANRDAIPWCERCELVPQVASFLTECPADEPFRSLMLLLAEDPKWEVRQKVAAALGKIPDLELSQWAWRLAQDSHAYVQRAAKQSIKQRQALARKLQKRKGGIELLEALREEFEEKYGRQGERMASRMAERMFEIRVSAILHEIRTIVSAARANVKALQVRQEKGALEPAFLQERLPRQADCLAFLDRIVKDLGAYARPIPEERATVAVIDLVSEAQNMVTDAFRGRGWNLQKVDLQLRVPDDVQISVARHHVVTALVNVLKNAYEALPREDQTPLGQISIGVVVRAGQDQGKQPGQAGRRRGATSALLADVGGALCAMVEVAVQDSGPGLAPEDLAEVRKCAPGKTSKRNEGTGFGLCSARRFIEAHNGQLQIDSQVGVGTTVTLRFPLQEVQS